jgi:hypothetical protein
MHDLVAKAFDQLQIRGAVVASREAKELWLAPRRGFNRGVRMDHLIAHLSER